MKSAKLMDPRPMDVFIPASDRSASPSAPASRPEPIVAHEIAAARWQEFCHWCTEMLRGMVVDIERDTGKGLCVAECLQRPLEQIAARELKNGVTAIDVAVDIGGKRRVFEVAGPNSLRLHCNAAGWPLALEIGYEEGKLVLHCSSAAVTAPIFSGSSWGE
ncbi:MAG: hypothetical protein ACHP79_05690 [Terriglobales bacterium]